MKISLQRLLWVLDVDDTEGVNDDDGFQNLLNPFCPKLRSGFMFLMTSEITVQIISSIDMSNIISALSQALVNPGMRSENVIEGLGSHRCETFLMISPSRLR